MHTRARVSRGPRFVVGVPRAPSRFCRRRLRRSARKRVLQATSPPPAHTGLAGVAGAGDFQTIAGQLYARAGGAWKQRRRDFLKLSGDGRPARPALTRKRLANWRSVLALDHALRGAFGFGLLQFLPERPCKLLQPGHSRPFLATAELPDTLQWASRGRVRRSCLRTAEGQTRLECLWLGKRNVLHCVLGQGAIGWQARGWLLKHIRGARWFDPPHRRNNNVYDALSAARLTHVRAEATQLCSSHVGPWGCAANHGVWQACGNDHMQSKDHTDDLFVVVYPDLAHDLYGGELPAHYGTEVHMAELWAQLLAFLVDQQKVKASVVRLNRWLQVWRRTRPMLKHWSSYYFQLGRLFAEGLGRFRIRRSATGRRNPATRNLRE